MNRLAEEFTYWEQESHHPDVESRVCDPGLTEGCLEALEPLYKQRSILEIGCGIGRLAIPLAMKLERAMIYGIDISPSMIEHAQLLKRGIRNCQFEVNDGRMLPDREIDGAYAVAVFQHLPASAISGYIAQLGERLVAGGIFRFQFIEGTEQEVFSRHYPIVQIGEWLNAAGLDVHIIDRGVVHKKWTWITAEKNG